MFFIRVIFILLSPKSSISKTISSFSLLIKCQIYATSLTVYLNAIYSILVVDMDIILCFLLLYKMTVLLKKKQCLMTDFWSSRSSAKLLSVYPYGNESLKFTLSSFWPYTNPSYIVFFKYYINLFAYCRWLFLGSELYLLSCPTIKAMSGLLPYIRYINLSMKYWYGQSSVLSSLSDLIILIKKPVFMEITFALHLVRPSSIIRSWINVAWPIFNMRVTESCVIYYPMIVYISLKSLTLYFWPSVFFRISSVVRRFETRRKLFR